MKTESPAEDGVPAAGNNAANDNAANSPAVKGSTANGNVSNNGAANSPAVNGSAANGNVSNNGPMEDANRQGRRIQVLSPDVARKIAAGEVIDRPAALAREFIDNAIDAGSASIELIIEAGGVRRTELADDGGGMGREDLELCWRTHATSKIRNIEDLNSAQTLGFRGEALAAAAAVSRLEILSSLDGREAWTLEISSGGERAEIRPGRRRRGTSVRALGLFDSIPARKRFLKREGTEAGLCKQALIDKALAFPSVSFRFIQDGNLKLFLPPAASLKERFAACLLSQTEENFLHEIHASGGGFQVAVVAGGPELWRRDRRQQYVFANGRRIQEFSLLQALEYGLQGWFPNGVHPVGAVYVQIDPALADFNIHPAKREVRFKDGGAIHHAITTALGSLVRHGSLARETRAAQAEVGFANTPLGGAGFANANSGNAGSFEAGSVNALSGGGFDNALSGGAHHPEQHLWTGAAAHGGERSYGAG
ncbi:MAG: DNA mismatch repair endonuclease MutL, partial [Spirochaetaceae bacterium]|nr:DNA mismatch repair endonuclease MutL [Spirochaetaceae bacterium]